MQEVEFTDSSGPVSVKLSPRSVTAWQVDTSELQDLSCSEADDYINRLGPSDAWTSLLIKSRIKWMQPSANIS